MKGDLPFGARLVGVMQNVYHGVYHFANDRCGFDVQVIVDNKEKMHQVDTDPQFI